MTICGRSGAALPFDMNDKRTVSPKAPPTFRSTAASSFRQSTILLMQDEVAGRRRIGGDGGGVTDLGICASIIGGGQLGTIPIKDCAFGPCLRVRLGQGENARAGNIDALTSLGGKLRYAEQLANKNAVAGIDIGGRGDFHRVGGASIVFHGDLPCDQRDEERESRAAPPTKSGRRLTLGRGCDSRSGNRSHRNRSRVPPTC
ncbi:hypothetical protein Atu0452 [Agrobacterium fabrum str. C58]|uniref:Uncharacterized protein n=1 Tax=Agrobacterium fabrum (strain C58 / ATCC 33970) TaxID=176299 RepID=Q8UI48_AGRFC|nr:hypothetical protein Atu0452 [Agrobacterium fabrum str. C58]